MSGSIANGSNHKVEATASPDDYRVFRASLSGETLSLRELDAGEAARGYRRWIASLDERAAALTVGKPSDEVARRILEVAETFLSDRKWAEAAKVLRLVAESDQFEGSQEHALASAALRNLTRQSST